MSAGIPARFFLADPAPGQSLRSLSPPAIKASQGLPKNPEQEPHPADTALEFQYLIDFKRVAGSLAGPGQ